MGFNTISKKQLAIAAFLQREETRYHHGFDEEMLQYEYIKNGDMRSIEESIRLFRTNISGTLSKNPVRHFKYLFVASTTLATRFAIRGGVNPQDAYNLSDLFIQKMDLCSGIEEIQLLQTEMIRSFTQSVIDYKKETNQLLSNNLYIKKADSYIYLHLHEKILVTDLAEEVGLSPNYLSYLFKKETSYTINQYIAIKKIEVAKKMLLYSDYTLTDIGNILAFSSTSHFISTFKNITGKTPRNYKHS